MLGWSPESNPGSPRHRNRHLHTDTQNHKKIPLLELIILVLTVHWLLSFFGQSIVPGIPHTGDFIDMLSVIIVILIIVKFLS
jgi:hypothetical protein